MTKTIDSAMQTHIGQEVTDLAHCWKITRKDGTNYYFTDHDVDLEFNGNTYKAATGFVPTQIDAKADMSVDNIDVEGPFGTLSSADITETDLLAGKFDESTFEIFIVNHTDPDGFGRIKLVKGVIGQVTRKRNKFVAEVRSLTQHLQQQIGNVYTPYCRADLGDSDCGVALGPLTVSGSVTSVTDNANFADNGSTAITDESDDYFNLGKVTWTSGDNDGLEMEVKDFTQSGGQFELVIAMPFDIQVGDTFDVFPGCDKTLSTCINKFNNVENFRGEPYIPGNDYVTTFPDAN